MRAEGHRRRWWRVCRLVRPLLSAVRSASAGLQADVLSLDGSARGIALPAVDPKAIAGDRSGPGHKLVTEIELVNVGAGCWLLLLVLCDSADGLKNRQHPKNNGIERKRQPKGGKMGL